MLLCSGHLPTQPLSFMPHYLFVLPISSMWFASMHLYDCPQNIKSTIIISQLESGKGTTTSIDAKFIHYKIDLEHISGEIPLLLGLSWGLPWKAIWNELEGVSHYKTCLDCNHTLAFLGYLGQSKRKGHTNILAGFRKLSFEERRMKPHCVHTLLGQINLQKQLLDSVLLLCYIHSNDGSPYTGLYWDTYNYFGRIIRWAKQLIESCE